MAAAYPQPVRSATFSQVVNDHNGRAVVVGDGVQGVGGVLHLRRVVLVRGVIEAKI